MLGCSNFGALEYVFHMYPQEYVSKLFIRYWAIPGSTTKLPLEGAIEAAPKVNNLLRHEPSRVGSIAGTTAYLRSARMPVIMYQM